MQPTLEALLYLLRKKKEELEYLNTEIQKRIDVSTQPETVRIFQTAVEENTNEIGLLDSEITLLERDKEISQL